MPRTLNVWCLEFGENSCSVTQSYLRFAFTELDCLATEKEPLEKNWHKMPRKIGKGYLMNSEQQTSSELQTFDLVLLLIWSSEIHFWTWLLKKSKLVVWRWRKHRRGAPTPETLWCTCGCIWTSSRGLCHSSAPVPWHGTVSSYPPPCILGSRHGACWSCKTTEEQKHTIIEQSCC